MSRRAIQSDTAPQAIGPYSQAISCGPFVFLSGQIGLDRRTGDLADGGTAAQTQQALRNLQAVLHAAELSFADVVRVTIYLVDLADFETVNELYCDWVQAPFPARATVGVASLPKGARVEIDAIAIRQD